MRKMLQYLLISFILGLFIVFMVITADSLAPEQKFLIIGFVMSQNIVAILWFVTLQTEVKGIMRKTLQYIEGVNYLGPIKIRGSTVQRTVVLERVSFFPCQALKLRIISIKVKSLRKFFNFISYLSHKGHSREYLVQMSLDPVRSQASKRCVGRSEHAMGSNILQLNRFGVHKTVIVGNINDQRLYYFYSRAPSGEYTNY